MLLMENQTIFSDKSRKYSADVTSLDSWSEAIEGADNENKERERPSGSGQLKKNQATNKTRGQKYINNKYTSGLNKNSVVLNPRTLNAVSYKKDDQYRPIDIDPTPSQILYRRSPTVIEQLPSTSSNTSSDWSSSPFDYISNEFHFSSLPSTVNRENSSFQNDVLKACGQTSKVKSKSYQGLNKHVCDDANSWPVGDPEQAQPSSLPPDLNKSYLLTDDVDQTEKVKNKLMSVWNNMKYGWTLKTKTAFKCDSPIFLLGACYHLRSSDEEVKPGERKKRPPNIEMFKQDFASQIWFTYRQDFPQIPGTKITSDCGWGCMLRSGQMMLARAFLTHFLGRDWNVFREQSREHDTYRRQIIRWFGDFPSENSPFSIHRLVETGKLHGKQPGEWYGPSSIAFILRDSMVKALETQPLLSDIAVYVAQDCTVYKQDVYEICCSRGRAVTQFSSSSDSTEVKTPLDTDKDCWKRSAIILVPVRLGGEELNPVYIPCLKSLLAQDCCIGIIGGKPKTSLYFVGWQDDKVIYLDPHFCQDAVDTRERNFAIQTFHCLSPRKVSLLKMDPSCTIGFYCRTREDFDKFVQQTEEVCKLIGKDLDLIDHMISPPKQKMSYPMFVFSDGNSSDVNIQSDNFEREDRLLRVKHYKMDKYGRIRSATEDSEEFVIL